MGPIRAKSERSSSSVPSYRLPMKTVRNRLPAAHASGELLRRDSDQLLQPRLLLRLRLRLRLHDPFGSRARLLLLLLLLLLLRLHEPLGSRCPRLRERLCRAAPPRPRPGAQTEGHLLVPHLPHAWSGVERGKPSSWGGAEASS